MFDSKLNSLLVLSVTKSITKTAEIVNLTQPSVTSQIKALEDEYDIKIIKRTGNDLIITPEGQLLIKHAEKIKSDYLTATQEIKAFKSKINTVKIGITSGIESTFIASVLTKLSIQHRNDGEKFDVKIIYDTAAALLKMLQQGYISLIITDDSIEDVGIKKLNLDSDNLVCVTAKNSDIAGYEKITLNELKERNLIIRLPNSSTQILFDAILRTHNLLIKDFKVLIELNSVSAIKNLVKNGVADAVLANNACIAEIKRGELITIPIDGVSTLHNTNIFYRSDFSHEDIPEQIKELYTEAKGQ